MKDSNTILQILETIQSFQVVKCNMHHEKVATDDDDNPLHKFQDDTIVFDRVNLCNLKHRKQRLGCAHSSVNVNFERILESLAIQLPLSVNQILSFKTEFQTTVNKIYTLDHKVGHLEHELAICKLTPDDNKKGTIMLSMNLLKAEHRTLMAHLSKIKSDIEQLIKTQLKYSKI